VDPARPSPATPAPVRGETDVLCRIVADPAAGCHRAFRIGRQLAFPAVKVARPGTFSIVAVDSEAGEVGCAVQSKYFAVGLVVPWVQAGVGAVATQAAGVARYGPRSLELLADGSAPGDVIERVLADDKGKETRQLAVIAADGRAAAFTGAECNDWAGHRVGDGYAVQGNILTGEEVVEAMERAWLSTEGALGHRLVAALEAGQAAGGDRRGQQSAAIVVERAGAADTTREGIDRICELRVEDHTEPIAELRRLFGLWERWDAMRASWNAAEAEDYERAAFFAERAVELDPDDPMMLYNLACYRALTGRGDDALALLERSLPRDGSLRENARTDSDLDSLRSDPRLERLLAASPQ
jgi:uncharacterized Ntn-hydrolase superfamily protein